MQATGSSRVDRSQRIYHYVLFGYLLASCAMAVYWLTRKDAYQLFQAVGTMVMPLVYLGAYKLLRIRRAYQFDIVILAFTFLAYSLGVGARWYKIIPNYDKIMHTLSGTFTMFLALPAFYFLKPEKQPKPQDFALALCFCLALTLSVAGLWEICEYFLNMITGLDVQNAAATGVVDTMQDMIVCMVGALFMIPPMAAYYRKGRKGFTMGAVVSFVAQNPGIGARQAA